MCSEELRYTSTYFIQLQNRKKQYQYMYCTNVVTFKSYTDDKPGIHLLIIEKEISILPGLTKKFIRIIITARKDYS